jgi:RimJ/RimL family protein N-acetyltransferase
MNNVSFTKLVTPTVEIAAAFERWENDAELVPLICPHRNMQELEQHVPVTVDGLTKRLLHSHIYLIYLEGQLIGEMNYQVDPQHLLKKEQGSAWIGINIGEKVGRHKGIGSHALQYLETQINLHGLKRIELGVFEFNAPALNLYKKLGFIEIGRVADFTFWNDRMWQDIRMEKYL